ncbi:MAG TPA: VOC family protein [Acidimicrobiales bacterium]|nr:VOC family protein [Acidimicrobiales bacterium]
MPQHQGFGHVTLTVTDLDRSADFYNRVFDAQSAMVGEDDHGSFVLCMGERFMVGLRKHAATPDGDSFHFARVGMDHMGVHIESRAELDTWLAHLDELDVEHSGIVESPHGAHLNVKDPDGIAIELVVFNS